MRLVALIILAWVSSKTDVKDVEHVGFKAQDHGFGQIFIWFYRFIILMVCCLVGLLFGCFGLWSVVCGLWPVVCGPWSVVCGLCQRR